MIPAGPGGTTRPLGKILPASKEGSVSDMDFILPDLNSESDGPAKAPPIVKLAPSDATVKLSPVSLAPRTGTGAIRLGGQAEANATGGASEKAVKPSNGQTVEPTAGGPGTVQAATVAAKTAKHGTVRLTGNQTEATKTAKHGTVRLTGNQTDAAKSASASGTQPAPVVVNDEKAAPKKDKPRRKKAPRPRRSNGGQDPWASVVFLILVILVVLLYVGFFIVRPKIIAVRPPAQPAPTQKEAAKPLARKPAARPKSAVQARPSGTTSPSAVKPKAAVDKPGHAADTPGTQEPAASASARASQKGIASTGAMMDEGLGEVDIPEDDDPAEDASATANPSASEQPKSVSKFAPPWARKDTSGQPMEEKPKEIVIEVPADVDVPEVREWPELRVTAVIGSGKKGSVLVNGNVVSVGEELEEGPVLKSVTRQAAIFEWDGDRRTIYVSSKAE